MKLSLIIPCYNEEGNIFPLYNTVNSTFEGVLTDYEFIFVNDGSYDRTPTVLRELAEEADVPVKVIHFARNFGKEAAIYAGLHYVSGDLITIMDGDLQQGPDVVVSMVQYLDRHPDCDCVTAFQETRKENPVMVFFKNNFYKIINRVTDIDFVSGASDFRTFRANVKDALLNLPESQRFSKGLFSWVGFETYYMPYTASERFTGTSKWNFLKLWKYALGGIMSFTVTPLRLPLYLGLFFLPVSGLLALFGRNNKTMRTAALIHFTGSLQLLSLGVLGEYIGRTYKQVQGRPPYIIKTIETNDRS